MKLHAVMSLGVLLVLGIVCRPVKAFGELHDLKSWTVKNGSEFIGSFIKEEGNTLHIRRASDNKVLKIAKSNLSTKTLAWYENAKSGKTAQSVPASADKKSPYQPIDAAGFDRSKIPVLDQSKYGTKASDCVPNSYAAFFLWWDQSGKIPIHKGRDFEAKAQWIHRELSNKFGTRNNSGTYYEKETKGIYEYFTEFHQKRYRISMQDITDVSPASLAKYTKGMNATVLSLTTYKGKRIRRSNAGFHAVTLIDVQADGRIELATWGCRLTGKMTPMEESIPKNAYIAKDAPRVIYEIIFDPDCEFPEWFSKNEYRFLIDPSNYSSLRVLSLQELKKS